MADEVASLLVRITADGSQAVGVLNGIQSTVGTLASSNATLMNKIAAGGALASKIGTTITKTVGVATVAGLAAAAKEAGKLNKELANIGTLSVPDDKLKQYKGKIQDIAIATAKSTSDISEGTYQVVSAFGDAADTMEKVEINAKAAKAGLATTADSINLTSAVTKAYGDTSAAAVQHVADLAFKTVELGQTTFPELASSMQQVTSLSKELGVSQEELFTNYATLTGVTGNAAEVQTQLKAVYTALLKPSENMTKAIKKQGYESGYTMIKTLGFAGTLDALKKATNGSEEEMLGLFNNVRAMPAIMALTGAQADTFATKLGKMEAASGAATKAFEVQTEGVAKTGFTLEQAKVKMQVAAQRFGESAAPIIADFAGVVDKASDALANMSDEQRKNVINAGVLTTKIGVGLAVGGKLVTVGTKVVGVAKAIAPALKMIAPAAAPLLGMVGGAGLVFGFLDHVKKSIEETKYAQTHFGEEVAKQTEKLKVSGAALKDARAHMEEYKATLNKLNSGTLNNTEAEAARERLKEIASYFNQKYGLELNVDSTEVQDATANLEAMLEAIEKAKQESNKDRRDLFHDLTNDETVENYRKSWDNEAAQKEIRDYNNGLVKTYETAHSILQDWRDEYDELKITGKATGEELEKVNQKYREKLKAEAPGVHIPVDNNNFEGAIKEAEQYIDDYTKLADEAQEEIDNILKARGEYQNGTSEFLAQTNAEIKAAAEQGKDYSQYLSQIDNLINRMGLKSKYDAFGNEKDMSQLQQDKQDIAAFAQATAAAQNGFDSFQESVARGGAALQSTTTNAVQNMVDWGVSAKDAGDIMAANLIRSGVSVEETLKTVQNSLNALGITDYKATITEDGSRVVIKAAQETKENVESIPEKHNTNITATDNTADGVRSAKSAIESITDKTVTITAQFVSSGMSKVNSAVSNLSKAILGEADGTQNFPGGLAMVNDQRGVADPRELIVDRGRAFIPEGRDVILPLSKGAKVYTAAETKRILAGIPHYAEGKNNSDAFTSARDDWQHYTRTHAVTTAEELEKWLEFQEKYKENEKDIWDIEEQVFSLRQKQYSEQMRDSEKLLSHQEIYNGLSVTDYLAGIDDMRVYTTQYYEQGIISHKEYLDKLMEYDEKYFDKYKEGVEKSVANSTEYIQRRAYFNNWAENGDTPLEAYERAMKPLYEALEKYGEGYWDEFVKLKKEIDTAFVESQNDQSFTWLDEQVKYFGMSSEEYTAGLERVRDKNITWYEKFGIGTEQQLHEVTTDINHKLWDEAESAYDKALEKQSEYISKMRDKFSKQEQKLRDKWTVADRKADMSEVRTQLNVYRNAVTDRGQQKYKELQEQMEQLQRDEKLYNLQVKNNAVIEDLEAEYKKAEDAKKSTLAGIARTNIDVSGFVNQIESNLERSSVNMESLLNTLINEVRNKKITVNTTKLSDDRKITYNISAPANQIGEIARGNVYR